MYSELHEKPTRTFVIFRYEWFGPCSVLVSLLFLACVFAIMEKRPANVRGRWFTELRFEVSEFNLTVIGM